MNLYNYGEGTAYRPNVSPHGIVDGSNAVFALPETPLANSLSLYVNGVKLQPVVDYTLFGTTLTFAVPPEPEQWISATYVIAR